MFSLMRMDIGCPQKSSENFVGELNVSVCCESAEAGVLLVFRPPRGAPI